MKLLNKLGLALLASAALCIPARAADDTIKVGVLHSLTGTLGSSWRLHKDDVLLFTFDEINAKGGVMGKKIEPVIVDGTDVWSDWAGKAKTLLEQDKVAVIFGCWTSVSRKFVKPVVEADNGLLFFYPVQ